jgi:acyl-coenzyme A synthetase/AMP-(fatty) acid ligase
MIAELIFDWASRTPGRPALIYNGQALSYRRFAHLIARARGFFARRGCAGSGHAVLAVGNLVDFWVLSLALRSLVLTTMAVRSVAAVGEALLPDVRCVVTSPNEAWPGLDEVCVARGLRLYSVSLGGEAALDLDATAHASGGHILRTSGTTGADKMVLMTSAIDAVFLRRKVDVIGMSQDTVLGAFDFAPWTGAGYRWAASPWLVGGTTLIEHGREAWRTLLHPGLSHAVLVPSKLDAILAGPVDAFPRNDALRLSVGGGAMTRAQVEGAKARITPHLFNWLASTEAGGIAFTPQDTPDDQRWHRLVSDRVVEIVDDSGRPAKAGEIGRVRVGAAGGPTRYLYDDAATRAFFNDGYFYPGDLAVARADGRVALQGRATDIINVGGDKISPAPIEDRLCDLLGVSAVCLFSMQDEHGQEEIHVVVETPTLIDTGRLVDALSRELRGFAQANVHHAVALPRNQMGKLLRQAVRAQVIGSQRRAADVEQPGS